MSSSAIQTSTSLTVSTLSTEAMNVIAQNAYPNTPHTMKNMTKEHQDDFVCDNCQKRISQEDQCPLYREGHDDENLCEACFDELNAKSTHPKTCQNLRETCHNKAGQNPFDLCNECLFFNALLTLRAYATDLKEFLEDDQWTEKEPPKPQLNPVLVWYKYKSRPSGLPKEYYLFVGSVLKREGIIAGLLMLEHRLLATMPPSMRDNQPDCSTILHLI